MLHIQKSNEQLFPSLLEAEEISASSLWFLDRNYFIGDIIREYSSCFCNTLSGIRYCILYVFDNVLDKCEIENEFPMHKHTRRLK